MKQEQKRSERSRPLSSESDGNEKMDTFAIDVTPMDAHRNSKNDLKGGNNSMRRTQTKIERQGSIISRKSKNSAANSLQKKAKSTQTKELVARIEKVEQYL